VRKFVSDDGAIALQRTDGKNLVNHKSDDRGERFDEQERCGI
jgi:hypothetical protein